MAKKIPKVPRFNHTSDQKVGMGDYYGVGVRNPQGRMNSLLDAPTPKGKMKPPKSLA
jgi:hypothetical protein